MSIGTSNVQDEILREAGASDAEADELLVYNASKFVWPDPVPAFPLPDEPFATTWRDYADEIAAAGGIEPLYRYLVQLSFPVEAGISAQDDYQAAVKKGKRPSAPVRGGTRLQSPQGFRLILHPTAAGRIPVLVLDDRRDFETFVQVFSRKNEPTPVPASMGAAMISGYGNWHRIEVLKKQFFAAGGNLENWSAEFSRIKRTPELYQDRFILLSTGPYSGVAAEDLGLDEESWRLISIVIRREHECAHYFTKRVFQSMQNNLLDELIADYAGLVCAIGRFRADWQFRFLGLESFPHYREGGRLQNYRGSPALSDGAFRVLLTLVHRAAHNLESFDGAARERVDGFVLSAALVALAGLTLEELASSAGPQRLTDRYVGEVLRQRNVPEQTQAAAAAY
jgi:hypothetical protein